MFRVFSAAPVLQAGGPGSGPKLGQKNRKGTGKKQQEYTGPERRQGGDRRNVLKNLYYKGKQKRRIDDDPNYRKKHGAHDRRLSEESHELFVKALNRRAAEREKAHAAEGPRRKTPLFQDKKYKGTERRVDPRSGRRGSLSERRKTTGKSPTGTERRKGERRRKGSGQDWSGYTGKPLWGG